MGFHTVFGRREGKLTTVFLTAQLRFWESLDEV